jgi:hypothetical protein
MTDVLTQAITPAVDLTLNGKTYSLAFPLSAVLKYKGKTGDNLFNVKHWSRIDEDPERLIAALWAGVSLKHPEMTYEEVSKLVDIGTAIPITQALGECLASFFPEPKPESADPNGQAAESQGK